MTIIKSGYGACMVSRNIYENKGKLKKKGFCRYEYRKTNMNTTVTGSQRQ